MAIGRAADLVVVAPATADLLARAAHGLADDLLTSTLLTATCPVLLAPAMHTEMWAHPATRANVATLRERGVVVVEPAVGRLTGADSGQGRLPEPEDLLREVRDLLAAGPGAPDRERAATGLPDRGQARRGGACPRRARPVLRLTSLPTGDLAGRRVVVTAGGTREPLDPVRFLGNASSGRQGIAVAEAARDRGADVHLVAAHVEVPLPEGVRTTRVGHRRGAARRRARGRPRGRRARHGGRGRRLPPRRGRRDQDQEDRRTTTCPSSGSSAPSTCSPPSSHHRPHPGPGRRRLRGRDRRQQRRRPQPRRGEARGQGLRPARGQRRLRRGGLRQRAQPRRRPRPRRPRAHRPPRSPRPARWPSATVAETVLDAVVPRLGGARPSSTARRSLTHRSTPAPRVCGAPRAGPAHPPRPHREPENR